MNFLFPAEEGRLTFKTLKNVDSDHLDGTSRSILIRPNATIINAVGNLLQPIRDSKVVMKQKLLFESQSISNDAEKNTKKKPYMHYRRDHFAALRKEPEISFASGVFPDFAVLP